MIKEKDFKIALDQVIKDDDDVIVLYSGIYSFINNLNFDTKSTVKLPERILKLIEEKVGKKRTLFLPSKVNDIILKYIITLYRIL